MLGVTPLALHDCDHRRRQMKYWHNVLCIESRFTNLFQLERLVSDETPTGFHFVGSRLKHVRVRNYSINRL